MYWCRLKPVRRHPPAEGYNNLLSFTSLSWKGATTPYSRLPASPGRELRPPELIYQPLLEGSYNPLTEGFDPQHHCRPRFINFQIGSNSFNTTLHLSTIIPCLLLQAKQWDHCNPNIKYNPDFRIDMQKHIQPWAIMSLDTIRAFI